MTKEEILKLHELSEDEQYKWLIDNKVLVYVEPFQKLWESLADCAFRLRDEIGARFYTAMRMLYDTITNDENPDGFMIWWMFSEPIHWIQAALLARAE